MYINCAEDSGNWTVLIIILFLYNNLMDKFFYIIFIKLYPLVARLLSPFNEKARFWIKGRKDIFQQTEAAIAGDTSKKIWMHCASLGEFEQGRPLLEKFKESYPAYKTVLTFFSPSGYEVQKDKRPADYVFYLPIDSSQNAKKFLISNSYWRF